MTNIIRFEDFSHAEIRVTEDGRFSVFDVIEFCGKSNPRQTWNGDKRGNGLIKKYPELVHKVDNHQFEGSGQRLTPVANKLNILQIIGLLPGAIGRAYREEAAKVFLQYLEASPELAGSIIDRASPEDLAKIKEKLRQKEQDRLNSREVLKNESRLRLTDQIKNHLERIEKYSDKKFTNYYFAQVHDAINRAITTETAKEMRERLKVMMGREIKESELIRDFFPIQSLHRYMGLCD